RAETEENAVQQSTRRAQNRESVSQALDRIRQAARQRKKEKFTALLHHISPEHLLHYAFGPEVEDATAACGPLRLRSEGAGSGDAGARAARTAPIAAANIAAQGHRRLKSA